jgi:hypothetical protein
VAFSQLWWMLVGKTAHIKVLDVLKLKNYYIEKNDAKPVLKSILFIKLTLWCFSKQGLVHLTLYCFLLSF